MNKRQIKIWSLTAVSVFLCITCIHPVYPDEIFLQHIATLIAICLLMFITVKNNISDKAFLCLILLLVFHITGARWNYSDTPYNNIIQSITGFSIDTYFDLKRNHYDRFVHLMFGFLLIIPLSEIYTNWFKITQRLAKHLAFMFILSASMIYELIEWMVAVVLSPDQAEAYNGQQGDIWDAEKDMALAMLGAVLMILILRIRNKKTATS